MNAKYFYETCLNDVCSAMLENESLKKARCQTLEAFADECREYNIHIQWRSKTRCCMSFMIFL